jgi:hypothetical protein
MRSSIRAVSFFPVVLAAVLPCVIASSAFASGDDKPATASVATSAAPSGTVVRPDREKKVYTNDDIDRMWPKEPAAASDSQTSTASASMLPVARRSPAVSRALNAANASASRENNPVWYAAQAASLYAELDSLSNREESLRDFRATGSDAGVTVGLQFDAPCEGFTTDNAIQQLAIRRQEIEQQISDLQEAAQQNGMPPAVVQNPSEFLQASRKPLSSGQERLALIERQSDLTAKLDGVQNQLADMSNEAAAQGIALLPPTPQWGGNLTTNKTQSLDQRANQLQNALSENEDAARQAGLAPSALP